MHRTRDLAAETLERLGTVRVMKPCIAMSAMFSVRPVALGAALIWGGHRGVKRKVETNRQAPQSLEKAHQTSGILVACRAFRHQYVDKHGIPAWGQKVRRKASS